MQPSRKRKCVRYLHPATLSVANVLWAAPAGNPRRQAASDVETTSGAWEGTKKKKKKKKKTSRTETARGVRGGVDFQNSPCHSGAIRKAFILNLLVVGGCDVRACLAP
ncbi:hypothetical protein LY78DRAFT_27463 [Colletotrichum sublineola]|nr:hypothetical protein LY78DRAFT_27463 [Colletotrichum sublineola]